jgi:hypothetical protein
MGRKSRRQTRKGSVHQLQQNNSLLTERGNFTTQKIRGKGTQTGVDIPERRQSRRMR